MNIMMYLQAIWNKNLEALEAAFQDVECLFYCICQMSMFVIKSISSTIFNWAQVCDDFDFDEPHLNRSMVEW